MALVLTRAQPPQALRGGWLPPPCTAQVTHAAFSYIEFASAGHVCRLMH